MMKMQTNATLYKKTCQCRIHMCLPCTAEVCKTNVTLFAPCQTNTTPQQTSIGACCKHQHVSSAQCFHALPGEATDTAMLCQPNMQIDKPSPQRSPIPIMVSTQESASSSLQECCRVCASRTCAGSQQLMRKYIQAHQDHLKLLNSH